MAYINVGSGTNGWSMVKYRFQTMPDATQINVRVYYTQIQTAHSGLMTSAYDQGTPAIFPFQTGYPVVASGWVHHVLPQRCRH